jgi:hypothetical protein
MVMVKATRGSESGIMQGDPERIRRMLEEMGKYNEELVNAGIMQAGEGLKPSSYGVRVRFSGTERTVIDGPFAQTNELVAGYWLWQVKDMAEAIAWVKKCPNPMFEDSEIEIRPLMEAEDFGEAFTPEERAKEEALQAKLAM